MTISEHRQLELDNMDRTRAYYALAADGFDWDKVREVLDPEFVCIEASDLPIAGEYRGAEGVARLYEILLLEMMDWSRYEVVQMMAGGDWVCSLLEVYVRRPEGGEKCIPIAETLRWRNGKLCEMKPYWYDSNDLKQAVEFAKITRPKQG